MRTTCGFFLAVLLLGCDPTVTIGNPDGGTDAGVGGGAAGGGGGATGGGGGGGDTLCTRFGSASDAFFAGQSSCMGMSNTITRDPNAVTTCTSNVAMCTTQDRAVLDTYLSCLETGPHCTAGNENTAVNGFMSCVSTAFASLSVPCRSALVRARPAGKRVFLTHQRFNGNLGGLTGANTRCNDAATAAGLVGTFIAWLSTTTVNAVDRLNDVGPWSDLQGTLVFANKNAVITTGPMTALWYDERGQFLSTANIWTGTRFDGVYQWGAVMGPPCQEWTSATSQDGARVGQIGRTGGEWTSYSGTGCNSEAHLVCFEQ